jgi:hypothetical protein
MLLEEHKEVLRLRQIVERWGPGGDSQSGFECFDKEP